MRGKLSIVVANQSTTASTERSPWYLIPKYKVKYKTIEASKSMNWRGEIASTEEVPIGYHKKNGTQLSSVTTTTNSVELTL